MGEGVFRPIYHRLHWFWGVSDETNTNNIRLLIKMSIFNLSEVFWLLNDQFYFTIFNLMVTEANLPIGHKIGSIYDVVSPQIQFEQSR
ncbi:MAG: hypothetical protein Ct9H300mP9_5600 [Candidatus Neomarinimicrobiota bacterium]|nr:MAG: hypothetical protein Ct9H300mP9_5600 [Candidatus Neomarinimicrobiota bacterium]